jgi:hypothetical protein
MGSVESGLTCEWIHRLVLALAQIFNTFACVCRISKDESTWEEVLDCELMYIYIFTQYIFTQYIFTQYIFTQYIIIITH